DKSERVLYIGYEFGIISDDTPPMECSSPTTAPFVTKGNSMLTAPLADAEPDACAVKVIIFISYIHEDKGITDALNNALQSAFGQQVEVFVDRVSIQQGGNILDTITDNLTKADVLAVVSTGGGKPSPDWAGFELGWFNATHQKSS